MKPLAGRLTRTNEPVIVVAFTIHGDVLCILPSGRIWREPWERVEIIEPDPEWPESFRARWAR